MKLEQNFIGDMFYNTIKCDKNEDEEIMEAVESLNGAIKLLQKNLVLFWRNKRFVESKLALYISLITGNENLFYDSQKLVLKNTRFTDLLLADSSDYVEVSDIEMSQSQIDKLAEQSLKTIVKELNTKINDTQELEKIGKRIKATISINLFPDENGSKFSSIRKYYKNDKSLTKFLKRPVVKIFSGITSLAKVRVLLLGNPLTFILTESILFISNKIIENLFGELDEEKKLMDIINDLEENRTEGTEAENYANITINNITKPLLSNIIDIQNNRGTGNELSLTNEDFEIVIKLITDTIKKKIEDVEYLYLSYAGIKGAKSKFDESQFVDEIIKKMDDYFNERSDWTIKKWRKEKIDTNILSFIFESKFDALFDQNMQQILQNALAIYLLDSATSNGLLYSYSFKNIKEGGLYDDLEQIIQGKDFIPFIAKNLIELNSKNVTNLKSIYNYGRTVAKKPRGLDRLDYFIYVQKEKFTQIPEKENLYYFIINNGFYDFYLGYELGDNYEIIVMYIKSAYKKRKKIKLMLANIMPYKIVDNEIVTKLLNGEVFSFSIDNKYNVARTFTNSVFHYDIVPITDLLPIKPMYSFRKLKVHEVPLPMTHQKYWHTSYEDVLNAINPLTTGEFEIKIKVNFDENNNINPNISIGYSKTEYTEKEPKYERVLNKNEVEQIQEFLKIQELK